MNSFITNTQVIGAPADDRMDLDYTIDGGATWTTINRFDVDTGSLNIADSGVNQLFAIGTSSTTTQIRPSRCDLAHLFE